MGVGSGVGWGAEVAGRGSVVGCGGVEVNYGPWQFPTMAQAVVVFVDARNHHGSVIGVPGDWLTNSQGKSKRVRHVGTWLAAEMTTARGHFFFAPMV